ncbi:MAG: nucleotidyltransferase family protein [Chloroflexi bacterium]|nr:nucleotidyltransferase family protein [Chloroflexota bacterium]
MMDWPDLRQILQPIDWVIVGGVATRAYMPERMTKDLDILIDAADEATALSCLQTAGYEIVQPLAITGYFLQSDDGMEIDLLLGSQPLATRGSGSTRTRFSRLSSFGASLPYPHEDGIVSRSGFG